MQKQVVLIDVPMFSSIEQNTNGKSSSSLKLVVIKSGLYSANLKASDLNRCSHVFVNWAKYKR